jgi:Microfibril-associated/Pre-mRNA processing
MNELNNIFGPNQSSHLFSSVQAKLNGLKSSSSVGQKTASTGKVHRYFAGKVPVWAERKDEKGEIENGEKITQHRHEEHHLNTNNQMNSSVGIENSSVSLSASNTVIEKPVAVKKRQKFEAEIVSIDTKQTEVDVAKPITELSSRNTEHIKVLSSASSSSSLSSSHVPVKAPVSTLVDFTSTRISSAPQIEDEDEDIDDEDLDEWGMPRQTISRPIFYAKNERSTLIDAQKTANIQAKAVELTKQIELDKKQASIEVAREKILMAENEVIEEDDGVSDGKDAALAGKPDDSDSINESEDEREFNEWSKRELERLKRDYFKKISEEEEVEESLRRKELTEAELEDLARKRRSINDSITPTEHVPSISSTTTSTKYHHKGAFYMDESSVKDKGDIRNRPVAAGNEQPTLSVSSTLRETLPEIMKVKNFGRKGQSKYKGLFKEDTSRVMERDDFYSFAKKST